MEIVRMILDNAKTSGKDHMGILGQIMVEHAKETRNVIYSDEDKELVDKMILLKTAEEDGDLLWIDYKSWNFLSKFFKINFEELMKPLLWGGVFCRYSDFKTYESKILSRLDEGIVANLVCANGVYQLFCVSRDAKSYQMMKIQDFKKLQDSILSNLIRSYARVGRDIVYKEFHKKGKDAKKDHTASSAVQAAGCETH